MLFVSVALFILFLVASRNCLAAPFAFFPREPAAIVDELKAGNRRFVDNQPRIAGDPAEIRRELLQKGGEPMAAVVACSDSPVPVEDIFSQPPGRLYVALTAGNTAGAQTIGTIQYGVARLHIPVLVILGHTRCAAVKAVVDGVREEGCLDRALDPIRQAGALLDYPIEKYENPVAAWTVANIRYAAESFLKTNPWLASRVGRGAVWLKEALYDAETGKVLWLDDGA